MDVREKKEKVAFPYKIGCGNAGGDWDIVKKLLEQVFEGYEGEVQIWNHETMK